MSVVFNINRVNINLVRLTFGITESLHNLLYITNENFIKQYSEEKYLLTIFC